MVLTPHRFAALQNGVIWRQNHDKDRRSAMHRSVTMTHFCHDYRIAIGRARRKLAHSPGCGGVGVEAGKAHIPVRTDVA
jgi:hypothetical protein